MGTIKSMFQENMTLRERLLRCLMLGLSLSAAIILATITVFALERGKLDEQSRAAHELSTAFYSPGIGREPSSVTVNERTGYSYVANELSNEITIISGTTVITSLIVGSGPRLVHANPLNEHVYVVNRLSKEVAIIRGTELITKVTFSTSDRQFEPVAAETDPGTGYTYIAVDKDIDEVLIFDGKEMIVHLPVAVGPVDVSLDTATGHLYVVSAGIEQVTIIKGTKIISEIDLASTPEAVATNSATGYTYIVSYNANEVAVLDNATAKIIATLPVEGPEDVGVNPETGYVYVPSLNSNGVTVISGTQIVTTLPAGLYPDKVGINPETGHVYVINDGGPSRELDTVTVISGTEVVAAVSVGDLPRDIAINTRTGLVYVANAWSNDLTIIEETVVTATIAPAVFPGAITYNPINDHFYVVDEIGDRISIVSGTQVLTSVTTGASHHDVPTDIAINPNDGLVYVSNWESDSVSIISNTQMIAQVEDIHSPRGVAVEPLHDYIYVASFFDSKVAIIKNTNLITQVKVDVQEPSKIKIDPETGLTYILGHDNQIAVISGTEVIASPLMEGIAMDVAVDYYNDRVYVADTWGIAILKGATLIEHIDLVEQGWYGVGVLAVDPKNNYLYAGDQANDRIFVISDTEVIATLPTARFPFVAEVSPQTGHVYLTHRNSPTINVISGTHLVDTIFLDSFLPYDFHTPPIYPRYMAIHPKTNDVYVTNYYHHKISILDLQPGFYLAPESGLWETHSGAALTRTVWIGSLLGFNEGISLTIVGWPAGITGNIEPDFASPNTQVTVSVTISKDVSPGIYPLTISGVSGDLTRTLKMMLVVSNKSYLPIVERN